MRTRFPFTCYPDSWYFVATSDQLPIKRRWLDRTVTVKLNPDGTVTGDVPVIIRNDIVFGWHGKGEAWFEPPEYCEDGWTKKKWASSSFTTHIQEVVENSVDRRHFVHVHKYSEAEQIEPDLIDGGHFRSIMQAKASINLPFINRISTSRIELNVHGLGYMLIATDTPEEKLKTRAWVLAVPEDGINLKINFGVSVLGRGGNLSRWMVSQEMGTTLEQDRDIWNNKRYLTSPRLTSSERSFLKFRQYCAQFYPKHASPITRQATPSPMY